MIKGLARGYDSQIVELGRGAEIPLLQRCNVTGSEGARRASVKDVEYGRIAAASALAISGVNCGKARGLQSFVKMMLVVNAR